MTFVPMLATMAEVLVGGAIGALAAAGGAILTVCYERSRESKDSWRRRAGMLGLLVDELVDVRADAEARLDGGGRIFEIPATLPTELWGVFRSSPWVADLEQCTLRAASHTYRGFASADALNSHAVRLYLQSQDPTPTSDELYDDARRLSADALAIVLDGLDETIDRFRDEQKRQRPSWWRGRS